MSEKELSQSRAGTSRGDSVSSDKDSTRKLRSGKKRFQVESPEGQTSSQRFRTDQPGDITVGSPRSELTGSALSGSSLTDRQNSETQPVVINLGNKRILRMLMCMLRRPQQRAVKQLVM